ncbi:MAG: wax ester synthase-like acyl-CoA acyltransferase domain-containing protein [Piptocephalis tieghemiana]|nr:MAG: wax ester synthase-like acyl-CoA acyltransferase domain-containing protein [Piptocephalis tieghemiana]
MSQKKPTPLDIPSVDTTSRGQQDHQQDDEFGWSSYGGGNNKEFQEPQTPQTPISPSMIHFLPDYVRPHQEKKSRVREEADSGKMERTRLGGLDNLFLSIERPDHLMTVASIWTFKDLLDMTLVFRDISYLLDRFPRFRQVPCGGGTLSTPIWVEDRRFEVERHVKERKFPPGSRSMAHLQRYAARWVAKPFHPRRPLWEMRVIQGLDVGGDGSQEGRGVGSAVIIRAHHCLADGQSFIQCLLQSTRESPGEVSRDEERGGFHQEGIGAREFLPAKESISTSSYPHGDRGGIGACVIMPIMWIIHLTLWLGQILPQFLHHGLGGAYATLVSLGRMALFQRRSMHYPGPRVRERNLAWSEACSFDHLKRIRRMVPEATINDIMIAVMTKAFQVVLENRGELHDTQAALYIPISLRDPRDRSMTNVVGGDYAFLPMDRDATTASLIRWTHKRMNQVKESWIARLSYAFAQVIFALPCLINYGIVEYLMNKGHAVLTNVPGPGHTIYYAGQAIERYIVIPPQLSQGSLGIGLISYNGTVSLSILGDRTPYQDDLAQEICREFSIQLFRMAL